MYCMRNQLKWNQIARVCNLYEFTVVCQLDLMFSARAKPLQLRALTTKLPALIELRSACGGAFLLYRHQKRLLQPERRFSRALIPFHRYHKQAVQPLFEHIAFLSWISPVSYFLRNFRSKRHAASGQLFVY